MEVGGLTETVEVTGASPIVDTVDDDRGRGDRPPSCSQRVPVGRRFSDALYIAPGVTTAARRRANPSIAGGSGLDNQYVVDGVNITNTGYGALGSYSIFFGSLGNGVTFDFIKEVQVKTGGYEAEFGQSTGGVVNVVTKSGTNNLRGSGVRVLPARRGSRPTTRNSRPRTARCSSADADERRGIEVGGPIVPDRLFFFGAINPQWETRTIHGAGRLPAREPWRGGSQAQLTSYSAKATWQLASGHRIDASFFGDPAKGDMGPQRASAPRRDRTPRRSASSRIRRQQPDREATTA